MTIAAVDDTHDPAIESWVESANDPATDFPLQNLPFGVFRRSATTRAENLPRVGVAIGDSVLDLPGAARDGLLDEVPAGVLQAANSQSVNALMACRAEERGQLRRGVSRLLRAGEASVRRAAEPHLLRASEVEMLLPAAIGNYTDFYASIFHATNVGRLFRPD
ncbi:MAG: fumarylacetoacetase, partial [Acidobacteria bacterium]